MATVGSPGVGTQPTFTSSPDKYTTIDELLKVNKNDNRDLLIKTYGDQGITGFLELTGATKSAGTNDFVQYWEEQRRHKLVALTGTSPSGTSGAVTLGTPLSGGNVIELQTVVMNAESGEVFICTTASTVFKRLDGADANTAWAATDSLIILGNMYDQGSEAPSNFMSTDATKLTNSFMIIKDKYEVNGSQATNIGWVNVGGDYRWYIHGEQETRQRFLDRREMMMLFGQLTGSADSLATNQNTTISDNNGGVAGSEGYFQAINKRGIEVTNGSANPLDSFAEFDNIILELDKQGAPAEYAMYVNRTQDLAIDDMLATGVATGVTAGLPGQFGAFQNSPDMAVQLGFKSFTRGGYTFHKHDWKLLNDPTLLGASTKYMGAMIPLTQVTDPRTGTKAPALELNYKEANGYSRELEHWVRGGGVFGHNELSKDVAEMHYRSEIALITRAANQHVALKG
jgi:hypothetical protein